MSVTSPHLKELAPAFPQVLHRSPTGNRIPPKQNVLEERLLHKVFLITQLPATWPAWALALGLVGISGFIWGLWSLAGAAATTAAGLYLFFALSDWLLLWWLPRAKRSFGPAGAQLYVMTIPRLAAAIVAALAMGLTGSVMLGLMLHGGAQLFGTMTYLWGALVEPFALTLTRHSVTSPNLPKAAPPIRVLHISDLHIEQLTAREARLLSLVEEAQPDLIVITGDYLNLSYVDDPAARREVRKLLARLSAPYGVYATLGSPTADPRPTTPSLFDGTDIRLLRDEVAVISFPDGRKLSLLGMDCEHDPESDRSAFEQVIELAPPDSGRIVLYHSPELMPLVKEYPVELYLCGHTHGGQYRTPIYGALITSSLTGKQYEMGRYDEQGTTLYVSRGVGLEGLSAPRMRLLCPPEIALFEIAGEQE